MLERSLFCVVTDQNLLYKHLILNYLLDLLCAIPQIRPFMWKTVLINILQVHLLIVSSSARLIITSYYLPYFELYTILVNLCMWLGPHNMPMHTLEVRHSYCQIIGMHSLLGG